MPLPGHVYNFVMRAADPLSIALAMREARAHVEVYSTWGPEFRDGRFVGAVLGIPFREWPVGVLERQVNSIPGTATRIDVTAEEFAGAVADFVDLVSRGTAAVAATGGALARRVPAFQLGQELFAVSPTPESGSGLSTGIVVGLVVAIVLVVGYVFREPLLSLTKTGAKAAAKAV